MLAGSLSLALLAAWIPLVAVQQDSDTAVVPVSAVLKIPLLMGTPLVLGGEVDLVAFTSEDGEAVVFQLYYNDRLIAESERWLETSFTIEESRGSPTDLLLVVANGEPEPVTVQYLASAQRPALVIERLWVAILLFAPLGATVAVHRATLRLGESRTGIAPRSSTSLLLTGWVFFLYVELLVGLLLLRLGSDLGALTDFFGLLLLLTVRTPFGLLPTLSAMGGLVLALGGRGASPERAAWLSTAMGLGGLAIVIALLVMSSGLGR